MQNSMLPEAERSKPARVALSVVIPSHNPEALFFIQIAKLLAAHPDWQVVVIDDGSDRSLQEFLPQTANLTVLRNATAQGAGTSRNIAVQAIMGDYTVFLDDDDFMDWGVVEQLMQKMDAAPAVDMAVSSYRFLRDGKLAPAHQKDQKILQNTLRGQNSRIVMLDDNEALLRLTNYPWNKLYRTQFIHRIGLRFSDTIVQNDVYAHWQSLLGASRILVTDLVQCTQTTTAAGSRISNTWDSRRLQAFIALRETYALVQRNPLPRVETAFWAFYHDLIHWMVGSASPRTRIKLMQEHVRFAGIAPRNMTALEADTGIKSWSLWNMENTEDTTLAAHEATGKPMDPARLEIWLSEISRLKRLSAELIGENVRLRGECDRQSGECAQRRVECDRQRHDIRDRDERIEVQSREIAELQRHLNSKAARWAFALRRAFRRVFPGHGQAKR